jgi:L-fucose isomerase, C-terminal domain.
VGQGTAFWTALKPGHVTIARLHNDHGQYRLVLMKGEALDRDRVTRGSMIEVKMEAPVRDTMNSLLAAGIPHHYVIVWDDIYDAMKQTAAVMNIPVLEL